MEITRVFLSHLLYLGKVACVTKFTDALDGASTNNYRITTVLVILLFSEKNYYKTSECAGARKINTVIFKDFSRITVIKSINAILAKTHYLDRNTILYSNGL